MIVKYYLNMQVFLAEIFAVHRKYSIEDKALVFGSG